MVDHFRKRINLSAVIALVIKLFTIVLCFALVSLLDNLQTVVVDTDADMGPEEGAVLAWKRRQGPWFSWPAACISSYSPFLSDW
jgi:hypothetical protein